MNLVILFMLFILCVLLPFMFNLLEGMSSSTYSTDILDKEEKYTTPPEERILFPLKDASLNLMPSK